MGKRVKGPKVKWRVTIDEEVACQIEVLYYDTFRRKCDYGARSQLITGLLRNWLNELKEQSNGTPNPREHREPEPACA